MHPRMIELYTKTRELHELAAVVVAEMRDDVKTGEMDVEELADLTYACRECEKYLDEMSRLMVETGGFAAKTACMLYTASLQAGLADKRSIHTPYCVATPEVKMMATMPNRKTEPEAYGRLMDHLGVPRNLWEGREYAIVKDNWPGLVALLTERAAEGKPPPPGIDPARQYSDYKLHVRGTKGVAAA